MEEGFLMALTRSQESTELTDIPLTELVEARIVLEPSLTRLAAKNATEEQIDQLEKDLELAAKNLTDVESWRQHDLHFHARLGQLSGNRVLAGSLDSIVLQLPGVWQRFQPADRVEQSHQEHRLILDSLRRRDAAGASRQMRNHLRKFESQLGLRHRRSTSRNIRRELAPV